LVKLQLKTEKKTLIEKELNVNIHYEIKLMAIYIVSLGMIIQFTVDINEFPFSMNICEWKFENQLNDAHIGA
jgi:hypothetical protein